MGRSQVQTIHAVMTKCCLFCNSIWFKIQSYCDNWVKPLVIISISNKVPLVHWRDNINLHCILPHCKLLYRGRWRFECTINRLNWYYFIWTFCFQPKIFHDILDAVNVWPGSSIRCLRETNRSSQGATFKYWRQQRNGRTTQFCNSQEWFRELTT